ncbi:MAG: hypothetical protein LBV14_13455 [Acidovorax sp.]|jgi:hypothetical protein|nr:hypothetical protein [Acidovorax sp.]
MDISQTTAQARAPGAVQFPPLEQEARPCVPTAQAAYYLNRANSTLWDWACYGTHPEGLRPVRVGGRLAWPVAGIKAVLGVNHA